MNYHQELAQNIELIENQTFGKSGVKKETIHSQLEIFEDGLITDEVNLHLRGYLAWEKHNNYKFPPYNHQLKKYHDRNGKYAYISVITVEEASRNQGVGSRLISCLIEDAKTLGCEEIYLPVNKKHPYLEKGILKFWEKNGFVQDGEVDWAIEKGVFLPSYIFVRDLQD